MQLTQVSDAELRSEYQRRSSIRIGESIGCSTDAVEHVRTFINDHARESFIVLFLSNNNRLIKTEVLFQGSISSSAVYPREILRKALKNEASCLILAHNHPSGNTNPSQDDITITKKIIEACKTVDIQVHDHLVVTSTDLYSFADHGLI